MSHRTSSVFSLTLAALFLSALAGCVNGVAPGGCNSDRDCSDGETCIDSTCVAMGIQNLSCQSDLDCNVNAGETCVAGACQPGGTTAGSPCGVTADCPIDQYCNSATGSCQALLAGWCRESAQCAGDAPVCSSTSASVPGRCVECVVDGDCAAGSVCVQPGVCEVSGDTTPRPGEGDPGTNPGDPGTNPGDPGTNPGDPGTDPGDPDPGTPSDECEQFGWYGDGECDTFCPEPDPDCAGNPGGGGGDPGQGGQCVDAVDCWSAGYSLDYTCDAGTCVCDVLWLELFVCDIDQTVDVATCTCAGGGGGGTGDECFDNGWYGDGECDTFCPEPDPDCGGAGGLGENAACVSNGQVLACDAGLECIWAADANNNPLYGACKRVCSSDADCGGDSCALGFLSNGNGICGTALVAGQSGCSFWEEGNTFCFNPNDPGGADDAFLECLNGTCGYVCDYDGHTEAPWTCPNGGTCGATYSSYDGYNVDLAVCQ